MCCQHWLKLFSESIIHFVKLFHSNPKTKLENKITVLQTTEVFALSNSTFNTVLIIMETILYWHQKCPVFSSISSSFMLYSLGPLAFSKERHLISSKGYEDYGLLLATWIRTPPVFKHLPPLLVPQKWMNCVILWTACEPVSHRNRTVSPSP